MRIDGLKPVICGSDVLCIYSPPSVIFVCMTFLNALFFFSTLPGITNTNLVSFGLLNI